MPPATSRSLVVLRLAAAASAALGVVQAVLAFLSLAKVATLIETHGMLGFVNVAVAVVAAIASIVWLRKGGSKGLMLHAWGMVVVLLVQIGLGEGEVTWPHVGIGIVAVTGSIALAVLASSKPGGAA